ncbi:DUF5994 family protein [Streptomyces sp. NPDC058280]|uniref:DUF5994 family protein n=1 Tax=Streptomyces sp. NPDC058280 TaxID=3346419 RepID=UPI0036DFF98E
MTTTLDLAAASEAGKIPAQPDESARPVRLTLAPGGRSSGALDGAWWPRSRDLALELPPLVAAMDDTWGRITRALVNPAHWPVVPRKVQLPARVLHVGWFAAEQDPHKVILLSYSVGRWDLLVIPPETSAAAAARLMKAAADPRNLLTASALVAGEALVEEAGEADETGEVKEANV